jgi:hypothetical protein
LPSAERLARRHGNVRWLIGQALVVRSLEHARATVVLASAGLRTTSTGPAQKHSRQVIPVGVDQIEYEADFNGCGAVQSSVECADIRPI